MYFSTRDFAPSRRVNEWREAVFSHCGEFQLEFDRPDSEANLQLRRIGSLACARLSQSLRRVYRTDTQAMRSQSDDGFVLLQLSGTAQLTQFDRRTSLLPGDVTLIDAGAPFEINLFERNSQICVHVPKDSLSDAAGGWQGRFGGKLPASTSYLLHSLVGSAFGPADCFSQEQGNILVTAFLALLANGWQDSAATKEAPVEAESESAQKVKTFIMAHLGDEMLNPRTIASAIGVSERRLHRIFSTKGESVSHWIRQCRLERCANEFRNPSYRERSITEIAYAWGFNDSAHFSRLFRKEFGVPPREYRRAALTH
ncbi:transcriptional regulator FeaR [Rhizorhabdus dicambivorans]|nr:transcriptional regulator FeaR [Rhizorhabdus dicambivorans]